MEVGSGMDAEETRLSLGEDVTTLKEERATLDSEKTEKLKEDEGLLLLPRHESEEQPKPIEAKEREEEAEGEEGERKKEAEEEGEQAAQPTCNCDDSTGIGGKRLAELRTVTNPRNANKGLRYWTCAYYQPKHWQVKRGQKRKKEEGEGEKEKEPQSCNFFSWIDKPRETKEEKVKAKKERLHKRELALLR